MSAAKTKMKFQDVKVGDTVFVVHQKRRGDKERRTETLPVVRVGRKYGYIDRYRRQQPFCLNSGESVHSEWNTRANNLGFDVYRCEQDWLQKQHAEHEQERLWCRIKAPHYGIITLPHESVVAIHKILDEAGIDRKEPQQ